MTTIEHIKAIVSEYLEETLFLVDVLIKGKAIGQKVIVLIDGDSGVSIDQCAQISRHLADQLDELDLLVGSYQLEVSSPGLDHPISLKRQFIKNKGRRLNVETSDMKLTGKLIQVEDELTLEVKEKKELKKVVIPLNEIVKANVLVSFK